MSNEEKKEKSNNIGSPNSELKGIIIKPGQILTNAEYFITAKMATSASVQRYVKYHEESPALVDREKNEHIVNYQRSFWETGQELYEKCQRNQYDVENREKALLNFYIGLTKLFGTHWTESEKAKYKEKREIFLKKQFGNAQLTVDQNREFNQKFPPINENTFSLYTMIKVGFVISKGWSLEDYDSGKLFAKFKELNKYCTEILKHYEMEKFEDALKLSYEKLTCFVNTIKDIIRWFMQKYYNVIPEEAKRDFYQIFKETF